MNRIQYYSSLSISCCFHLCANTNKYTINILVNVPGCKFAYLPRAFVFMVDSDLTSEFWFMKSEDGWKSISDASPAVVLKRLGTTGLRVWGCAGNWPVRDEVRIINHFFSSWGQTGGLLWHPSVWFHKKVARGSFCLRAYGLKGNFSKDVILACQWSRSCVHCSGLNYCLWLPQGFLIILWKSRSIRDVEREEKWCLKLSCKLYQSHFNPTVMVFGEGDFVG